ncbi:hypothetical protein F5883DRAFT_422871, partial [Diaporthe sp. PMI_573]
SLEGLIDFSAAATFFANEQQRTQAVGRFRRIVDYFEAAEQPAPRYGDGYNRPALVRLTFEYAHSQTSQDRFLGAFFRPLALGMLDDDSVDLSDDSVVADSRSPLFGFAEFLMTNFFLPRITSIYDKTPQPSPVYHAAVQQAQTQEDQQRIEDFVGTPERLSTLRGSCLTRDRHCCVITHTFDIAEAMQRLRRPPATDYDGNPLNMSNNGGLEVAHISPMLSHDPRDLVVPIALVYTHKTHRDCSLLCHKGEWWRHRAERGHCQMHCTLGFGGIKWGCNCLIKLLVEFPLVVLTGSHNLLLYKSFCRI